MMEGRLQLHVLCCLLCALSKEVWAVIQLEGTVGEHLNITCSPSHATSNIKYFCRGSCNDNDVLIRSKGVGRTAQKGRFSLYDRGGGRFTITISELTIWDSGQYWCVVERFGMDSFTKLFLKVLEAPQIITPPKTMNNIISTKGRRSYIPAGVFAVLVILVASLMLRHHWENICSVFRACLTSMRGQTNTGQIQTTPEDQSSERMRTIYENMKPGVCKPNPASKMLHAETIQINVPFDGLVSKESQKD